MQTDTSEVLRQLFAEMESRADFPVIGDSVWHIVTAMDLERDEFDLAKAILADAELTERVLTTANSVMYARGQRVPTVTQAVTLLGYRMVGHLALRLKLEGAFQKAAKRHGIQVQRALYECQLAGAIAKRVAQQVCAPAAEEAGVCGFLHRIGRVLMMCYLPAEAARMERERSSSEGVRSGGDRLSHSAVGQAVVARWRLPARFIESMSDAPLRRVRSDVALSHVEWLNLLSQSATQAAQRLSSTAQVSDAVLDELADTWPAELGIEQALFRATLASVLTEQRKPDFGARPAGVARPVVGVSEMLARLKATLESQAGAVSLTSLVGLAMEGFHRVFGARRVAFLSKESGARILMCRHVVGDGAGLVGRWSLESDFAPDVFHLAVSKNAPIFVSESEGLRARGQLPANYLEHIADDPAFLVLPLCVKGAALGLLYVDWEGSEETLTIREPEKRLLVAIRDILVREILTPRNWARAA